MINYSKLDLFLHQQFLGRNNLTKFFIDRLLKENYEYKCSEYDYIFITGLARSGSTAMLNKIYEQTNISSFLYSHMPFILIPELINIYKKFSIKKNISKQERFHNDGIFIDLDSPECLDEVFWRNIDIKPYKANKFKPYIVTHKICNAYGFLIRKLSEVENNKRMVIKNNNNHFRLESLLKEFNNSTFIYMFRDPFSQACSLLKQHKNFIDLQIKNKKIINYMNLLGHHEFGKNIKPFVYLENDDWFLNISPLNINYWITQWIKAHEWILNKQFFNNKNFFLINYEKVCDDSSYLFNIFFRLNLTLKNTDFIFTNSNTYEVNKYDIDIVLLERANQIYKNLLEKTS